MNKSIRKIFFCTFLFITGVHLSQSQVPLFEWAKNIGDSAILDAKDVRIDLFGNVITCGHFDGKVDFDPGPDVQFYTSELGDGYVMKQDKDGNLIWAIQLGDTGFEHANALTVDYEGNIFVAGSLTGFQFDEIDIDGGDGVYMLHNYSSSDIFLLKLNSNGEIIWGTSAGAMSADHGHSIALDSDNNVYLAARVDGDLIVDHISGEIVLIDPVSANYSYYTAILKYDTNGNFQWARQLAGTNYVLPVDIAIDHLNNVAVAGNFNGITDFDPGPGTFNLGIPPQDNYNLFNLYVCKLNSDGYFLWAKAIMTGYGLDEYVGTLNLNCMTQDSMECLYLSGSFKSEIDFDPGEDEFLLTSAETENHAFLLKLNSSGEFEWARQIEGNGVSGMMAVAESSNQTIVMTGYFRGVFDFDLDEGIQLRTSDNANVLDIFVSAIDSVGNFSWFEQLIGGDFAYSQALACVDSLIYVAGYFNTACDFDPGYNVNMLNAHVVDVFVQKLINYPVDGPEPSVPAVIDFYSLYPIPSNTFITLSTSEIMDDAILMVYDVQGRIVANWSRVSGDKFVIDSAEFASGVYCLEIHQPEKELQRLKFIVAR